MADNNSVDTNKNDISTKVVSHEIKANDKIAVKKKTDSNIKKSSTTRSKKTTSKTKSTTNKRTTTKKENTEKIEEQKTVTVPVTPVRTENDSASPDLPENHTMTPEEIKEKRLNSYNLNLGDANTYYFYEFICNPVNGDPLSLAIIDNNDNIFYAEFSDYNLQEIPVDIFMKVIKNFINPDSPESTEVNEKTDSKNIFIKGTKEQIQSSLFFWLLDRNENSTRYIQFVSDKPYTSFDRLLKFILGNTTIDSTPLPLSSCVVDINQTLASSISLPYDQYKDKDIKNYNPYISACAVNRLKFINSVDLNENSDILLPKEIKLSLDAAIMYRYIFNYLWNNDN